MLACSIEYYLRVAACQIHKANILIGVSPGSERNLWENKKLCAGLWSRVYLNVSNRSFVEDLFIHVIINT